MLSKELLSDVLKESITYIELKGDTNYAQLGFKNSEIVYVGKVQKRKKINIYELAHECKQWAVSKGYSLYSGYDKLINKYGVYVNLLLLGDDESTIGGWDTEIYFIANTEPEAIFKACQYIMENKCGS